MAWFGNLLSLVTGGKKVGQNALDKREAYARGYARGRGVKLKYDAAGPDEDNAEHWLRGTDSYSADAANSLPVRKKLRERARYETDNNGYLSGVVETVQDDLIGTGPRLQLSGSLPEGVAEMAEAAWSEWRMDAGIDDALQVMVRSKIIDGESFGQLVNNPLVPGLVKLAVVPLECDQVTDSAGASDPRNVDGVMLDEYGNVAAYRCLKNHPGGTGGSKETIDIPAGHMLHWYKRRRPGQHRGISDLVAAIKIAPMLRRYGLATLRTAESQAENGGVIEADTEPGGFDNTVIPEDTIQYERGMITALPAGYRFKGFDPTQPNSNHDMFTRNMLQEMGRGLNVPLVVTLMNASGFNFASGRLDHLIYWKHQRIERDRFTRQVIRRLFFAWWREWKAVSGFYSLPERPAVRFIYPGFEFLDILKESKAYIGLRDAGVLGNDDLWMMMGKDPEQARDDAERSAQWRRKFGYSTAAGGMADGESEPSAPWEEGNDDA